MRSATRISIIGNGALSAESLLKGISAAADFPIIFNDENPAEYSDFLVQAKLPERNQPANILLVAGNLSDGEVESLGDKITDGGILIFSEEDTALQNSTAQNFIRKIAYNPDDLKVSGGKATLQTSYGSLALNIENFENISVLPAVLKLCGQLLISEEKIMEFLADF